MEHSAKGFAAIVQILSDTPVHDKPAAWQRPPPPPPPVCCGHQLVQRRTEVVCPLPVRPVRGPCLVDNANAVVYCRTTRPKVVGFRDTFQRQQQAAELELLDFLLGQDQDGDDLDPNDGRFFFGTPPDRTGNPIVHDAEFCKQSLAPVGAAAAAAAANTTTFPVNHAPTTPTNTDHASPPSFKSAPSIRVEGFPSAAGRSGPQSRRRVVSALA